VQHVVFKVCIPLLALLCLSSLPALAQSTITTIAGGVNPVNGAQATTVSFASTESVTPDGAGGFYFSTGYPQHSIYRVAADGTMTLVAGDGTSGFGGDGGPATSAQLNSPSGIAVDAGGNLLIVDSGNQRIRKVTPGGVISTLAGTGTSGFSGDGGPAASAQLNYPQGIVVDGSGNVLIADSGNYRIRKITPAGVISTIAGSGSWGFSGDNGPAISAQLAYPTGVAVDSAGALFIADQSNARIRKVATNGTITTVAGGGSFGPSNGDGGLATAARLSSPSGVAVDASGNLLIADRYNYRIRRVNLQGIISTVAGNGSYGSLGDGGLAVLAQLRSPRGISVDTSGNLFIADTDSHRIRKVTLAGIISTVAGNGTHGFGGDGGPAVSALLDSPGGVALDSAGNLYIADTNNARIRQVTPGGVMSTFAGNGVFGSTGDGGPAIAARLDTPAAVATSPDGSVYIADCSDGVRRVNQVGTISTFATNNFLFCIYSYYDYYGQLSRGGVAVDAAGNVYVADTFHYRVYKVTPDGISAVAGSGSSGFAGDGGSAIAAQLTEPWGIAVDATGNLYIADAYNNRIRIVTPAGIINTVAGSNDGGFSGDGGPAVSAQLNFPTSVVVDTAGNLFIADSGNQRIRRVDAAGIITTVAGNGLSGVVGDGGPPTNARLDSPRSVAVDAAGNLYIADQNNHRIRKVMFALTVPTLTKISSPLAAVGLSASVALEGTSFAGPLTIDAGSGITVTDVRVLSETQVTATFAIASNATTGTRNVNVTTSKGTSGNVTFEVVPPFPDLSISSSQTGNWEVGFNGSYTVNISNKGSATTTGSIVVTDTLPTGFTFVSGTGTDWSCSSSSQEVTCSNSQTLAAGDSTTLTMTVAVGSNAGSRATHSPTVTVDGDLVPTNNSVSDDRTVQAPFVSFTINPTTLAPGSQATVALFLSSTFTHDMTGTLTLGFSSNAVIPADDPAIQFSGGGRTVNFTIPANSNQARFAGNGVSGPIAFQTGTVAGTIAFAVVLETGTVQTAFSNSRGISRRAPTLHSARKDDVTATTLTLGITVSSTSREITQLVLAFLGNPTVTASCGNVSGCTASGSTLTLDVKSLFETWFTSDSQYGSVSTLHVPLSIVGKFNGSILVSLRNTLGPSNPLNIPVP
jgi:uncharacterized repeat protein (TIGR01451 family)